MSGYVLSDKELLSIFRKALTKLAERDLASDTTTEDADYVIVNCLIALNPTGQRRDIVEREILRDTWCRYGELSDEEEDES